MIPTTLEWSCQIVLQIMTIEQADLNPQAKSQAEIFANA
jgi:hypothetical protein